MKYPPQKGGRAALAISHPTKTQAIKQTLRPGKVGKITISKLFPTKKRYYKIINENDYAFDEPIEYSCKKGEECLMLPSTADSDDTELIVNIMNA